MDQYFWSGEEIFITDDGMRPLNLTPVVGAKILFINETKRTLAVRFVNSDWRSPPISPGESAAYTPENAQSIVHALVDDSKVQGHIQVQPCYEPGETAEPSSPSG